MANTETTKSYTVEFAQATDRKLADLHGQHDRVSMRLDGVIDSIHFAVGDERDYNRYRIPTWRKTLDQCLAMQPRWAHQAESFAKDCAALAEYRAQLATLQAAIDAEDAVYAQHCWPRFFLCVSSDGHIHSSTGCSTCNYRTRFGWLPDLSGLDEAAAVAAHGAKLCTVCYPSAPVEWTNFFESAAAAKKAAQCTGTGKRSVLKSTFDDRGHYHHCPDCGKYARATRNGLVRAHKPERVTA